MLNDTNTGKLQDKDLDDIENELNLSHGFNSIISKSESVQQSNLVAFKPSAKKQEPRQKDNTKSVLYKQATDKAFESTDWFSENV